LKRRAYKERSADAATGRARAKKKKDRERDTGGNSGRMCCKETKKKGGYIGEKKRPYHEGEKRGEKKELISKVCKGGAKSETDFKGGSSTGWQSASAVSKGSLGKRAWGGYPRRSTEKEKKTPLRRERDMGKLTQRGEEFRGPLVKEGDQNKSRNINRGEKFKRRTRERLQRLVHFRGKADQKREPLGVEDLERDSSA